MKKVMEVSAKDEGKRLDAWLVENLAGCSKKHAKRLLDAGRVRIGGKKVYIAGWKTKSGDKVEISEEARGKAQGGFVKILYEDRDIIVAEKPAGMLSVSSEAGDRSAFADQIKAYLRRKYQKASYLKPVHRLDSETSGVMVFAKSKAGEAIEEQFEHHTIERRYLAIVEGAVEGEGGRIKAPLEKGEFGGGKKVRIASGDEGKDAVTEYYVKERYSHATLLDVRVRTGRTHQIRVHLSEIGHPIIGDKLYGGRMSFPRQALHAYVLGFRHPATGKKMKFESQLPDDMAGLVDELRG